MEFFYRMWIFCVREGELRVMVTVKVTGCFFFFCWPGRVAVCCFYD